MPGTRIAVEGLGTFSPGEDFLGLEDPMTGTRVFVLEVLDGRPKAAEAFLPPVAEGRRQLRREEVSVAGFPGVLVELAEDAPEGPLRRWVLVFGDETESVVMGAVAREPDAAAVGGTIERALRSVSWDRGRKIGVSEYLPIELEPAPPLAFGQASNNSALYSIEGRRRVEPHEQPLVLVSVARVAVPESARAEYGMRVLRGLSPTATDVREPSYSSRQIHGRTGYEVVATATATRSPETRLTIAALMFFDEDRAWTLLLLTPQDRAEESLDLFRRTCNSARPLDRARGVPGAPSTEPPEARPR